MLLLLLLFWSASVCVCTIHSSLLASSQINGANSFSAIDVVSIQPPLQASPCLDSGDSLIIDISAHPYQWAQELAGLGDGVEEGQKKEQNVPVGSTKSGEALQMQKVLQLLLKQAKAVGKADSAGLQKAA